MHSILLSVLPVSKLHCLHSSVSHRDIVPNNSNHETSSFSSSWQMMASLWLFVFAELCCYGGSPTLGPLTTKNSKTQIITHNPFYISIEVQCQHFITSNTYLHCFYRFINITFSFISIPTRQSNGRITYIIFVVPRSQYIHTHLNLQSITSIHAIIHLTNIVFFLCSLFIY